MGIESLFDRIFVIHLARWPERRAGFERAFAGINCSDYDVIDAVDGDDLDLELLENEGRLDWCKDQDRALFSGEVGCFLSHMQVYERIVESGINNALICEDDIVFHDDALSTFEAVMCEVPAGWDIVHFFSHFTHDSGLRERPRIGPHVRVGQNESASTVCYAITRRCAQYFLDHGFPMRNPIDGVTNWPSSDWCKGYIGYIADSFPCQPSGSRSTIGDKLQRR